MNNEPEKLEPKIEVRDDTQDDGKAALSRRILDEGESLAHTVALNCADEEQQVGDFVQSYSLADGVTDFRFACHIRGYEGWQWAVTLYRDQEREQWTVNDSVLVATDESLLAPQWVPWKDRITADDLSVTDSIGTDSDDPRIEDGYRHDDDGLHSFGKKVADSGEATSHTTSQADTQDADRAEEAGGASDNVDEAASDDAYEADSTDGIGEADAHAQGAANAEDTEEAVETLLLSRRHIMSPLGRSQTAKRWYQGQHGPKSLSTKTADGNLCSTCGFYVPLVGELGNMFGVCANKWSPDDGRAVSVDHGCGEHSEIGQPEPSHLWVQTEPAYDDVHIDVVEKKRKNHHAQVELLEQITEDAASQ